jgi:hypothetical protein
MTSNAALPGFNRAVWTVPLLWGPVIGTVVAAVLVLGGSYLAIPRERVTPDFLLEAFKAVAFAGVVVSGLSSAVFGYPVARWLERSGRTAMMPFVVSGAIGGCIALAVWKVLVDKGLVFVPYFPPWALAFPIYGVLYAVLFRWRAAKG